MQTLAHRKLRRVCKQEMKGIIRMKRADDFEVRRQHIANLTDEELYQRFWELTDKVVDPLLELGKKNTTPSQKQHPPQRRRHRQQSTGRKEQTHHRYFDMGKHRQQS